MKAASCRSWSVVVIIGVSSTFALGGVHACCAEDPPAASLKVDDVIRWLPVDTELVAVAKGPFMCELGSERAGADLLTRLREMCMVPLSHGLSDSLGKRLTEREIGTVVHGARRFQMAGQLGLGLYDGACVIVFQKDLANVNDLVAQLRQSSTQVSRVEEHEVFCCERLLEKDLWRSYVVRPEKNLVIAATDKSYLAELLRRRRNRPTDRALSDLPQWRYVNRTSPLWAIRQFKGPRPSGAPASDAELPGMVYCLDAAKPHVTTLHYFSSQQNAVDIARRTWSGPAVNMRPVVNQVEDGVVSVVIELSRDKADAISPWLLISFGFLISV